MCKYALKVVYRLNTIDVIMVLNEQDDYTKANNYWRWLKKKLKNEENELVSITHGFKFTAPDGKKRNMILKKQRIMRITKTLLVTGTSGCVKALIVFITDSVII